MDLTRFCSANSESDPPLYPVCRAWILNGTSYNDFLKSADTLNPDNEDDPGRFSKTEGVFFLPEPKPRPVTADGNPVDLRIPPKNDKRPEASKIDSLINSVSEACFDSLMEENMIRWKGVRKDWKHAADKYHELYKDNFKMIESM